MYIYTCFPVVCVCIMRRTYTGLRVASTPNHLFNFHLVEDVPRNDNGASTTYPHSREATAIRLTSSLQIIKHAIALASRGNRPNYTLFHCSVCDVQSIRMKMIFLISIPRKIYILVNYFFLIKLKKFFFENPKKRVCLSKWQLSL